MTNNTIIYARVASENQLLTGINGQLSACLEYCKEHNLNACKVYAEAGIGGMDKEAIIVDEVIGYCIDKDIKNLVITDLNRLSRKISEVQEIMEIAEEYEITIHITGEMSVPDASKKLRDTILFGFATYERELSLQRMKAAIEHKKLN